MRNKRREKHPDDYLTVSPLEQEDFYENLMALEEEKAMKRERKECAEVRTPAPEPPEQWTPTLREAWTRGWERGQESMAQAILRGKDE